MVKNIIFDFGGVIMTIDQNEAMRRFAELGLKDAERWLDPYTQSGIFGDVEDGKITAEDFRQELSSIIGRELSFDDCKYGWLGYRKEVPQRNLDILRQLRNDGYRLILLSNTNPFMMSWALSEEFDGQGHSLYDYFDSLYLSYKLGVMKPSPVFFQKVLDCERLTPSESIFVDDGTRNVEAAAALGLHTFCPKNGEEWTKELLELLRKL